MFHLSWDYLTIFNLKPRFCSMVRFSVRFTSIDNYALADSSNSLGITDVLR